MGIISGGDFNPHPRTWKWPGISATDGDFPTSGRKILPVPDRPRNLTPMCVQYVVVYF